MVQLRTESGWKKMGRLVIDGNSVYEIDEECERKKMMDEQKRVEENHPTGKSGWNKDGTKVPLRRG